MERFVLQTTASELTAIFGVSPTSSSMLEPTFNAAPGYLLPVIFAQNGQKKIASCIWNPSLPSTDLSEFMRHKNASHQLTKHACLLPISGFYVWKQTVSDPLPFFVRIHSQPILGIPGFFSSVDEARKKFTIFTRPAGVLLKPLDHTMPCILDPHQFDGWVNQQADSIANSGFMSNEMIPDMTVFRVPDLVNDLSYNGPELIQPIPKLREDD